MGILERKLPTTVLINGVEYPIRSNFRTMIKFEQLMQDPDVTDQDKVWLALRLFYPEIPEDTDKAVDQLLWFYRCDKRDNIYTKKTKKRRSKRTDRIYDFECDDDYIYAAFMSQYRLDLHTVRYLHWWKFRAMFNAIDEDTLFHKIMEYRAVELDKVPKEKRAYYKRMKQLYALPLSQSEEERQNALEQALLNGQSLEGLV